MRTATFASRFRRTGSTVHWVKETNDLLREIKNWALEAGWTAGEKERTLTEDAVGIYTVRMLTIQAPEGCLTVEPIALRTPELNGRVDLVAYPSLTRMLLLRDAEINKTKGAKPIWELCTSDGLDWPLLWSRETFLQIAQGLLQAS